jgi:OOP family OmpA-OmpF porin
MRERMPRVTVLFAAVGLAALTLAAPASAQESYLGGTYSWTNLDTSGNAGSNPTGAGYKLFIGHDFKNFLGIEAGYTDFGTLKGTASAAGSESAYSFNGTGWDVALTAHIPFGSVVGIYGKIGYLFWTTDLSSALADLQTGSSNGSDVFYAAGLRFNLGRIVALLVEYEWDNLGDNTSMNLVNAGLRINF